MESYYSSDEEIAWGPVSFRELKGDLKRTVGRKPNRRHSVICNFQNSKMAENHFENNIRNKKPAAGTSVEYDCSGKYEIENIEDSLESNIHDGKPAAGAIAGTFVEYACSGNDEIQYIDDSFENNHSEKDEVENVEDSFENIHDEKPAADAIAGTFVKYACSGKDEIQYIDDSLENNHDNGKGEIENVEDSFENDIHDEKPAADAIASTSVKYACSGKDEIQYIDDSFENNHDNGKGEIENVEDSFENDIHDEKPAADAIASTSVKYACSGKDEIQYMEDSFENNIYDEKLPDNFITGTFVEYNKSTEGDEIEYGGNSFKNYIENKKQTDHFSTDYHDVSDICQEHDENTFFDTPNRLSTIKETLSTSPIIVPDIDFKQFDSSKDDSLQLNDTLEEMNRFLLCQGANYSMSDDEIIDITPAKGAASPHKFTTPLSQVVPVKQLFPDRKEKASHIPRGKFAHSEKKTATKTPVPPKADFKIPGTPFRSKPAHPTTPRPCTNLKNVVSPVALYIKNSPRVPLMKHVHPKDTLKSAPTVTLTTKTSQANKENFPEFPEVVYKPSKNQIESRERHIVVPSYMRNLKIKETQITKHEGRINHKPASESMVSEKLLQSDITNTTVDISLLEDVGNTSVLTSKQAFIK